MRAATQGHAPVGRKPEAASPQAPKSVARQRVYYHPNSVGGIDAAHIYLEQIRCFCALAGAFDISIDLSLNITAHLPTKRPIENLGPSV